MDEELNPRVTLEERSVELQRAKQKRPQNSIPKIQRSRITLEDRFVELQRAKQKRPQNSIPKIQRVANHLRNRKDFAKHYFPKFLSIGPIHHGDPEVHLGEQCKLMWAAKYIESTDQTPQILHRRIADNIEVLKDLFAEDVLTNNEWFFNYADEGFHSLGEKLSWMLFVDGCSLLHILEKAKFDKPDQLNVKVDRLVLVIQDVLLLENQLPYLVLKMLWRHDNNDSTLIKTMKNFLSCHHWTRNNYNLWHWHPSDGTPTHLLDLQRNIFILSTRPERAPEMVPHAYHVPMEEQNNENNSRENNNDIQESRKCAPEMAPYAYHVPMEEQNNENNSRENNSDIQESRNCAPEMAPYAYHVPMEEQNNENNSRENNSDIHESRECALEMVPHAYHVPMEEQNNENNLRENNSDVMVTFRNIQELRATGIKLKSSKSRRPRDISFSHGWLVAELTLPEIVVDDTTAATFLNLIAYEMCPDFENDYGICSFAAFMDTLIDHPEDVKALRSAGILINSLGSDEEVANLFNIICSDLVSDMQAYSEVRDQIGKYYKKKMEDLDSFRLSYLFQQPLGHHCLPCCTSCTPSHFYPDMVCNSPG